jgi:hypothetical protein
VPRRAARSPHDIPVPLSLDRRSQRDRLIHKRGARQACGRQARLPMVAHSYKGSQGSRLPMDKRSCPEVARSSPRGGNSTNIYSLRVSKAGALFDFICVDFKSVVHTLSPSAEAARTVTLSGILNAMCFASSCAPASKLPVALQSRYMGRRALNTGLKGV